MIDFELSEEQILLQGTAASFARQVLRPEQREREQSGELGAVLCRRFDEAGLAALAPPTVVAVPAEGAELGALDRCLALERLGWGDAGATVALLAARWAQSIGALLGVGEALRGELAFVQLTDAVEAPLGWLPLSKPAPVLLLELGGRWRVVEPTGKPARGLGLGACGGWSVTAAAPRGEGEATRTAVDRALAELWLGSAALLLGLGDAAQEHAAEYLRERVAFGKRLADHQGLAFLFADMAIRLEAARWLVRATAWRLDRDSSSAADAAEAWLQAREAALWLSDQAVQLLGGHGYMRAHPVEKWMRDARTLALLWGGEDIALDCSEGPQRWT
jgi:alkylation response protein AidB-like acyl-CoA dehydrogenase